MQTFHPEKRNVVYQNRYEITLILVEHLDGLLSLELLFQQASRRKYSTDE